MVQFDLPLDTLRSYRYARAEPANFDQFWDQTLSDAVDAAVAPKVEPVETRLRGITAYDVTFSGFGGDPIRGWWLLPAGAGEPLPVVVEFLGYGGGRGLPHERLLWANHGYGYLVVDSRGQGSIWNSGDTPDPHGSAPSAPGFLTKGVDAPENLYYRRLFTDAARAVDVAGELPGADPKRIAVLGTSQGGGMALAAAALNDQVAAVAAKVPFLCGIDRSVVVSGVEPYAELGRYLAAHRDDADRALDTLAYIDGAFLASRIRCPAWVSVGLMDPICPPSGVFSAINSIPGRPEVQVWPYNGHEGGGAYDDLRIAEWLHQLFAS